jgi:hypothetical protein
MRHIELAQAGHTTGGHFMLYPRSARRLLLPSLLALLAGCGELGGRAPLSPAGEPGFTSAPSVTLIECPLPTAASATGTIGLLGGTLRVVDSFGGVNELVFPAGAVSVPTLFKLTVPASDHVVVRLGTLNPLTGVLGSIVFPVGARPTLTVSYKRCDGVSLDPQTLHLYNVDAQTGAILEGPFGADAGDTSDPRVEGAVPHFSDYAVGSPD